MPQSPRLALPLIAAGQSQKDVTHNEALLALDRMVALTVVSRSQPVPPVDPLPGDMHIVPAIGASAWAQPAGALVQWQGTDWLAIVPPEGQIALVADEGVMLVQRSGWQAHWPVSGLAIAGRTVLAGAPAHIEAPVGGVTVDTEARATVAALVAALQEQGILAT
jgi:hypothetical protein